MRRLLVTAAASSLAPACEWTPPLRMHDTAVELGAITGEVVVVGPEVPADVYVLIYDADNPGPPAGLGRPINFDVIPKEVFEPDGLGSWSAPWGLTHLPAGDYVISGLHDTDLDFSPMVDIAGGSTCGDWGGGYVGVVEDADGNEVIDTIPLTLEDGELLEGVPVAIQVPIPIEKPAFVILGGDERAATGPVGLPRDGLLHLQATAVGSEYVDLVPLQDLDRKLDCAVSFPFVPIVSLSDAGEPTVDGFETPTVYLSQVLDEEERAQGVEPIVIEGVVETDALYLSLLGQLLADASRPAETLELLVRFGQDGRYSVPFSTAEGGDGDMDSLPDGPWAVTVVNAAGQTWTVPNTFGAAETHPAYGFVPATQAATVMLQ